MSAATAGAVAAMRAAQDNSIFVNMHASMYARRHLRLQGDNLFAFGATADSPSEFE
jgi:hypothetical protein